MEDLENVNNDAPAEAGQPSLGKEDIKSDDSKNDLEVKEEEKDLTNEELQEEIVRLKDEVKNETDAKEKRHKEQDIGWKQKIIKERGKAKELEQNNIEAEARIKSYETSLINEAYEKTIDDNFGLDYFENLNNTNPDIAEKLAQQEWGMSSKDLIFETKKTLADNGDEVLKKEVSEQELRSSIESDIYHKIAIEQVEDTFKDLEETEKLEAKAYFDDIVEGKKLTPTKAKKYAEMATFYVTRNKTPATPPIPTIDKEGILIGSANTGIKGRSDTKEVITNDVQAVRQQLLNSGISQYQVDLMYPIN